MNCEEALLLISAHLDNMNSPEEETALQTHLSACPECRAILKAYEEADADLAATEERAPAGLCGNVMAQIKKENRKKKFRPWAPIAAAAALFLVIGVGAVMEEYDVIDLVEEEHGMQTQAETAESSAVALTESEIAVTPRMVSVQGSQEDGACAMMSDAEETAHRIAQELEANIVLINELYYEIENFQCMTSDSGYLLYLLPDRDTATVLCENYGCLLVEQSGEMPYYALLIPQE